jgi:hypothetical protein
MARPKNLDNRYELICQVTGKSTPTNPKQFRDLTARYGITAEELDKSYVNREGRRIITDEKLTPEQAVEKYGIHINVAKALKATVKPASVKGATPSVDAVEPTVDAVDTTELPVTDKLDEILATETVAA